MWYSWELTDSMGTKKRKSGYCDMEWEDYWNKKMGEFGLGSFSIDDFPINEKEEKMEWFSCVSGECAEVEVVDEDRVKLMFAFPGFSKKHLSVKVQNKNRLFLEGKKGIFRTEEFKYEYVLGKNVKVKESKFEDGVLIIELFKEVPEAEKPVEIEIL